ncbi:diguanylate cyclase [Ruminococcaceae bacterium OttesenSCG-928-I18]|nr:diguanylate cyclase [Ruminococcaceae bacterium OttesenSCG-928-I18]
MGFLDTLREGWQAFLSLSHVENWIWLVVTGLIAAFCAGWFVRALMNRIKKGWDVFYFLFAVLAVFLWALFTLLGSLETIVARENLFASLAELGRVFVPGLLCLHIWKQVSYKDITPAVVVLCLSVPAVLSGWLVYRMVLVLGGSAMPAVALWWHFFYYVYAFGAIIKSYLLCFNVFYQMPRHMRRSAYYMLITVTVVFVANLIAIWESGQAHYYLSLLTTGISLFFLYEAFFAASSSNVIVTSRDFVFGSLSTMCLVLSRGNRILDWNKKTPASLGSLPKPRYRETFDNYRRRIIQEGGGRVSPHGNNIIIINQNGVETQYLITVNEVRNQKRQFGFIAEISEITKVYRVLRLLEDIATIDQLTGLLNRNAYLNTVQRYVEENVLPLVVVVGDVNKLKHLNDTLGHLVGDELLKTITGFIREHLPPQALAFRIGGDEFVLLLPGGELQQATRFMDAVNAACAATHDERFGTPSISWGVAVRKEAQEDYNDVFYKADQMMYAAKRQHFQFTSSGMVPAGAKPPTPSADAGQPPSQPPSSFEAAPTPVSESSEEKSGPAPLKDETEDPLTPS